nr:hypothetical protein CFP56_67528 [Quercus suber]
MATRYSKDKYARIKDLKNEPLAKLTSDLKKRKFGDEKVDAAPSSTVNIAPSSPTPSLEVTAVTTPKTCLKGKSKIGQSVWDDPATTLGCPGESLRITTDYLNIEEKVVVATSKAESMEVECSQLKKNLISVMNERNEANQKIKELTEALRVEKALVVQKDEEIQLALLKTDEERVKVINNFKESEDFTDLQFIQYFKGFELLRRWAMKHHNAVVNFSNLDFEKIDIEILEDESKEPEKDTSKETEMDKSAFRKKIKQPKANSPHLLLSLSFSHFLFYLENNGYPLILEIFDDGFPLGFGAV